MIGDWREAWRRFDAGHSTQMAAMAGLLAATCGEWARCGVVTALGSVSGGERGPWGIMAGGGLSRAAV